MTSRLSLCLLLLWPLAGCSSQPAPPPQQRAPAEAKFAALSDPERSLDEEDRLAAGGRGSVETLAAALESGIPAAQRAACATLARLGPEAGGAEDELEGALAPGGVVRGPAAWALALAVPTPDSADSIGRQLTEGSEADRLWLVSALHVLGSDANAVAPTLCVAAEKDPSALVRIEATVALSTVGEAAAVAPTLRRALRDSQRRSAALCALIERRELIPQVLPTLLGRLGKGGAYERSLTLKAIAAGGPVDASTLRVLSSVARTERDPRVRAVAEEAVRTLERAR